MSLHLVIGTPMYGGMCTSEYTDSLLKLSESCNKSGVKLTTIFLGNESLIQRGRNTIAHHFMNLPDATHLLFIDADIKFRVEDIVRMIKADKELIIGPVALKGYNWEEIRQVALAGEDDIGELVVSLISIYFLVLRWKMRMNHLRLSTVAMPL